MFLRILKKDLKRKKTMNIILLLFVILSVMFASSSVNNIINVSGGIDYYFEKAGMTDYIITVDEPGGKDTLSELLEEKSYITGHKRESLISATSESFTQDGEIMQDYIYLMSIMSIDEAKLNYFDSDNNIISRVEPGKVYISGIFPQEAKLDVGESFDIKIGETELRLEYTGRAKDAYTDAMGGSSKFIVNRADYDKLIADPAAQEAMNGIYYINTTDIEAIESEATGLSNLIQNQSVALVKTAYIMDMLVAGILLIVSICLILVSFVVLRFTIGFTISEEFREIGIMKAVGIGNSSIRGLYLVKYLGISVIGAVIGYFLGVPFGNMLLASVSENIVLGNDDSVITGILCSIAVVAVIMLFCWSSTRRIKKLSPVDAVRSGQTGERFRRKSLMHLGKSKLGATGFLSLNDVLSSLRQYGIITAVFTICMLLVMILANTANTLKSKEMLFIFGMTESDVYYLGDTASVMGVMNGTKTYDEVMRDIEKTLDENNMPGKVYAEEYYQLPIAKGDNKFILTFQKCRDKKTSDYLYSEGTPPKYEDEIAVTPIVAERLGADIGDRVTLTIDGEEKEFTVTALFQSMFNLGEAGRVHESLSIPETATFGFGAYQIDFDDHPDKAEILSRVKKLRKVFGTDLVHDATEYVTEGIGVVDIINSVKFLILMTSLIIVIMISVLMERSFIAKEKSEIALMKALGFKNSSVVAQHTLRFMIVGIAASVIAIALSVPLTNLCIDPIFSMMGAISGVSYKIEPVEVFAVYPLIILAATAAGAFFTALCTKTIKASDTASIE